jgi:hypothetical protein
MAAQANTTIDGHKLGTGCCCIGFSFVLVPENEFGISEQEPKPDHRHGNQADRRDEIPKAILGHRQRYRDRTTPQLNLLVKLDADAAG